MRNKGREEQEYQSPRRIDSPTEHHNEIHDVPPIAKVGAFMEYEAQGDDLDSRLQTEHPNEVRLGLLLLMQSKGKSFNQHHNLKV